MQAAALLYLAHKERGRFQEALRFLEINRKLQDSLFNEKNVKEITLLEANHQFESERQGLALENARQRYFQRLTLAGLAIVLVLLMARPAKVSR